jgi:hypothetical protein
MRFRRMACDCCKASDAPKLCQAPTYVMSEVTDNSNVVFVLMTKRGKRSCGGPLAVSCDPAGYAPAAVDFGQDTTEPSIISAAGRTEAILAGDWRPAWCLAGNDDFEQGESPIRRNRRLLEEGSGFWPRVCNRGPDGALREWE